MVEISSGLANGILFFVILKGRQLGITTISLALDLYWHFTNAGLGGTLVTDTEENRDMFRGTLGAYMEGVPKEYKIPMLAHNRNSLSLKNRSRIFYQVAGLRAKGSLGRGKGITFLHGTETSSWGDEEGLASLLASLAETNPDRLYIFESTARGFNMFHEMYVTAKRARTRKQSSVAGGAMSSTLLTLTQTSTKSIGMANSPLKRMNGQRTSRSSTTLKSTQDRWLGGVGRC